MPERSLLGGRHQKDPLNRLCQLGYLVRDQKASGEQYSFGTLISKS